MDCSIRRDFLAGLSDELLLAIVEFLGCSTNLIAEASYSGPWNISNLVRCSRRLHRIGEPVLYSHFSEKHSYLRPASLMQFLCQILRRPELAKYVKVFSGLPAHQGKDLDVSFVTEEDWAMIEQAVRDVYEEDGNELDGGEITGKWVQDIQTGMSGSWSATIALVLSRLKNLEELELHGWMYNSEEYLFLNRQLKRAVQLQERGETSAMSLSKLWRISIIPYDARYSWCFLDVMRFLCIPSVRNLAVNDLYEVVGNFDEHETGSRPHRSFSTRRLSLHSSKLSRGAFQFFMPLFHSLERFYYQENDGMEEDLGAVFLEPPLLLDALIHLKHCLREIIISARHENKWSYSRRRESYRDHPIGSLAEFKNLKTIDMEASMLIGKTFIPTEARPKEGKFPAYQDLKTHVPSTLESLTIRQIGVNYTLDITEHDLDVVTGITELIQQKSTYASHLKRLNLMWIYGEGCESTDTGLDGFDRVAVHPGFTREEASSLWSECERAGIHIVVMKWENIYRRRKGMHGPMWDRAFS